MGEVVYMPIPPKTETFKVGQHEVTLTFFPHEPVYQRWKWVVSFVARRYHYGYASSIEAARKDARKRITELQNREINRA